MLVAGNDATGLQPSPTMHPQKLSGYKSDTDVKISF